MKPKRTQPVRPMIDPKLVEEIEDFRFKNRIPTLTAAFDWLLRFALKQKPKVEQ